MSSELIAVENEIQFHSVKDISVNAPIFITGGTGYIGSRLIKKLLLKKMATNYYIFIDKFIAPCDIETAYRYIKEIEDYPRWWGKVYKKITKLKDAPQDQPGAKYSIMVGGFLPYVLKIENEVTYIDRPYLIRFTADGDLQGKGVWSFREVEGGTEITFDWRVAANKKIIRWFSFLLKPLFRANHHYCVVKAKEGIEKDLVTQQQLLTTLK